VLSLLHVSAYRGNTEVTHTHTYMYIIYIYIYTRKGIDISTPLACILLYTYLISSIEVEFLMPSWTQVLS
jgi:hypothetical protein